MPQAVTHTLVLVRHAEAESWAASDLDRALTGGGTDTAARVGAALRELGVAPEHALVSGAVRTRQTWTAMATAAGWSIEPEVDPGLYTASPDSAIDLVRLVDEEVGTLLVLGHNPTIHFLAEVLADGQGDPDVADRLVPGFPPGSVAVLEFDVPWSRVNQGYGRLVAVRPGNA